MPASKLLSATDTASRLRVAVARIDRLLGREVLRSDLTRTQFSVLATLAREGELRLSALGEREGLNPTMLSRVVAALERAGWVERAPDPDDAGRVAAALPLLEGLADHLVARAGAR